MPKDVIPTIRENLRKASDALFAESGIRAHVYESSEDAKITKDDDEDQDSYSVSYDVKLASVDAAFIGLTSQEVTVLLNFARYVCKAQSLKDHNERRKPLVTIIEDGPGALVGKNECEPKKCTHTAKHEGSCDSQSNKVEPKECEHFRERDDCQNAHKSDIKEAIEKYGAMLPAQASFVCSTPQEIHIHVHGTFSNGVSEIANEIARKINDASRSVHYHGSVPQGTGGPGM